MTDLTDLTGSAGPHPSPGALPDFLRPFAAMHDAMRRDAARLERAVDRARRPTDAQALRAWWQRYAGVIHDHHHREDDLVWPALDERAPTFASGRASLEGDHVELERRMAEVDRTLTAMATADGDPALACDAGVRAIGAFRSLLVDHLAREESLAFPLLAETHTAEEYAVLERKISAGSTLRSTAFELPWVLDGADPEVRAMIDELVPGAIRLILRVAWQRRYERVAAPVLEVA